MFDALHLSATDFAWILLSVVVGALVQGSIGFGLNLIVVPVAAWLRPDSLPSTMILMSLPLTAGSALRESAHIDRSGVLWTTIGRLPGVALGAWVVAVLEPDALATLIGGIVVLEWALCRVWLRRHASGPVELIQRRLAYGRPTSQTAGSVGRASQRRTCPSIPPE